MHTKDMLIINWNATIASTVERLGIKVKKNIVKQKGNWEDAFTNSICCHFLYALSKLFLTSFNKTEKFTIAQKIKFSNWILMMLVNWKHSYP